MTDITIPPAALEAGARALCSRAGYEWTVTPDVHNHWRAEARAAFLAMIEAWPGMECNGPSGGGVSQEPLQPSRIILPLPTENPDAEA